MDTNKVNVTIEKQPKSMVKMTIVATEEDMSKSLDKAYTKLSKNVTVKGFRKGTAPKSFVLQELGTRLFEEGINEMIWDLTDKALKQEELNPISQPSFEVAPDSNEEGKPFTFFAFFAVFPSIVMGDITAVKIDKEEIAHAKEAREKEEAKKQENLDDHSDEEKTDTEGEIVTLENAETKIEEDNKKSEPEATFNLDAYYSKIITDLFALSEIEIPDVLVNQELENHSQNFFHKLQDLQIDPEDYVKMQNTTIEELKDRWREEIEFTYKQDLLLSQYAKDNNIDVTEEEVRKNLEEVYPPETLDKLDANILDYAAYSLKKQKAFMNLVQKIEDINETNETNK